MAIITTPSASNANSFVDLTFANAYFATKFGADLWSTFSTGQQEALLVSASERVSLFKFGGTKTIRTQSLEWPRKWLTYADGYAIPDNELPLNLKKAVCEMSYWIWTEEDRLLSDTSLQQVEDFKAGPLTLKVKLGAIVVPSIVEQMLRAVGPGVLISTDAKSSGPVSIVR